MILKHVSQAECKLSSSAVTVLAVGQNAAASDVHKRLGPDKATDAMITMEMMTLEETIQQHTSSYQMLRKRPGAQPAKIHT